MISGRAEIKLADEERFIFHAVMIERFKFAETAPQQRMMLHMPDKIALGVFLSPRVIRILVHVDDIGVFGFTQQTHCAVIVGLGVPYQAVHTKVVS